jgi:hypothetical protein
MENKVELECSAHILDENQKKGTERKPLPHMEAFLISSTGWGSVVLRHSLTGNSAIIL